MKTRHKPNKARSPVASVFFGMLILTVSFITTSLVIALIAYNTPDPTAHEGLLSILSFVISGGVGVFINTKLFGRDKTTLPLFSSLFILIIFLTVSLISCGKITVGSIMSSLCFILVTLFLFFIAKRKPAKYARRKRN